MRRRAYIETRVPLRQAVRAALEWSRNHAVIHVGTAEIVDENRWIRELALPITSPCSQSRFHGSPRGAVIGCGLNVQEVLQVETNPHVGSIVVVQAHAPLEHDSDTPSHAVWISAFDVEHLGGDAIAHLPEASTSVKAAVARISGGPGGQGEIDQMVPYRSVQALTGLLEQGIAFTPDGIMVEALRNGWNVERAEALRRIAAELSTNAPRPTPATPDSSGQ